MLASHPPVRGVVVGSVQQAIDTGALLVTSVIEHKSGSMPTT